MFSTDKGESVSGYVSRIAKMIDGNDISYQLTSMGTIIETSSVWNALTVTKKVCEEPEGDCSRICSTIKPDIRKGKENKMKGGIRSTD